MVGEAMLRGWGRMTADRVLEGRGERATYPVCPMSAPHLFPLAALGCALAVSALAENTTPPADQGWMQWRGPLANGVAPHANPPTEWSEQKNVRWKIPLPGKAHSSPIVFGDRVYLTAAVPVGEDLPPLYDTASGAHDGVPGLPGTVPRNSVVP